MTRGRCGTLRLHRMELSSTTSRRFAPAHQNSGNKYDVPEASLRLAEFMPKRFSHLILFLTMVFSSASGAAATALEANLLGYGHVAIQIQRIDGSHGSLTFNCENERYADILLSKLRADLTWDKSLHIAEVEIAHAATALKLNGYGYLLVARKGKTVHAIAGSTIPALLSLIKKRRLLLSDLVFKPRNRHPDSLDAFDLKCLKFERHPYYMPPQVATGWQRFERRVNLDIYRFWNQFDLGMGAIHRWYLYNSQLVDGPAHVFPLTYDCELANAAGQAQAFHLGAVRIPRWFRNRFPNDLTRFDPYAVPYWLAGDSVGNGYLSLWASDQAMSYVVRNNLEVLAAVRKSTGNHLALLRVAFGRPGDELGLHMLSTELMCYGPADQRGFRWWLRNVRKLDLRTLGKRWHGDPTYYHTWDEVQVPSYFQFFGDLDNQSLLLTKAWLWRRDSDRAHTEGWGEISYRPGDEWVETDLGPSMQQYYLFADQHGRVTGKDQQNPAWFRKEFNASDWVKAHQGKEFYLVINTYDRSSQPVEVYLNGKFIGKIKPAAHWLGPISMPVTDILRKGRNLLVIRDPDGIMRGPVFFTTRQPVYYPYLGRTKNALWVDFRDWQVDSLIRGWKRQVGPIRQRTPDLPLQFVPGTSYALADHFLDLKRDIGINAIHNTGSGSSFRPWWPGLGYVLGTFGTSEEGGTSTDPLYQSRQFGWLLLLGEAHHNFYWDSQQYIDFEKKTHWFTKNRRMLQLFGKSHWARPAIALFKSAKAYRYFPYADFGNTWDLGRGVLQAAHRNCVYVTEAELCAGLVESYPILFDCNNPVLTEQDIRALEKYVRAGGIFIALNATGRHGLLEADSWPISRLTGYRVIGEPESGKVTILRQNPLLQHLAGMTFAGVGIAAKRLAGEYANRPIALQAVADRTATVARWQDGSVAIGMRQLGKGKIIMIGATFWRSRSNCAVHGEALRSSLQTAFLNDLFTGLGVPRQIDCNRENVWAVRHITKNGLQEWMMAYNTTAHEVTGVELSFPYSSPPAQVVDMVTGKTASSSYKDGWVHMPNLRLKPHQLLVFGVPHGGFVDALTHWTRFKAHFFKQPDLPKRRPYWRLPPYTQVVLDQFRFKMGDRSARQNTSWTTAGTAGSDWQNVGYGFWQEMGYPTKGIGLYRCRLDVPEGWIGRRIQIGFCSYDYPVILEQAAVYVNGRKMATYKGHSWWNYDLFDITSAIRPGRNEMAFLVEAAKSRGGVIGQIVCFPLQKLGKKMVLQTGWKLYTGNKRFKAVDLPTDAVGRNLAMDADVPGAWQGRQIFLRVTATDDKHRSVSTFLINGRPLNAHADRHPFRGTMEFNITPWVRCGQTNRIEIWPFVTILDRKGRSGSTAQSFAELRSVVLGIGDRKEE